MDDLPSLGGLPALPAPDWRFEVWLPGKSAPLYRGRVDLVRPPLDSGPPSYRIAGAGRMARAKDFRMDCAYAKPYGADIKEVFAWVADHFLAGPERLGEFAQAIEEEIGYRVEHAAFFDSDVQQAFDRMAEAAQDLLIWGFDATPGGADRLYVRKRPVAVVNEDYRFRVGKDVQFLEHAKDMSELANALRLIGGPAKAPNLVFNPSFELPRNPSEEGPEGNLLVNGGFTSGGGWNYTPDANSIEQESGGEPGEYARTGNKFGEFDDPGDRARQAVTLVSTGVGAKYRLVVHHAKQNAGGADPVVHVTLEGLDGANAVTETLVDPAAPAEDKSYGVLTSTARSYQEKTWDVTLTSAATVKLRVTIEYASGGSSLIDDVYLFQGDALINEGWQRVLRGSALVEMDWACQESPFHGCYCVRATPSGTDGTAANCVRIRPTRDHWISVRDRTQHEVKVRVRGAAGLALRLGLQRRGGGGGSDYHFADEQLLSGTGDWETVTATISSAGMTEIRPVIELRSDGTYDLDAVEVYESGVESRTDFLPGENLEYYFRTDNGGRAVPLTLADLSAEAQASIATYGLRERQLEIGEIEDLDQAKQYATGYLNRYAVPQLTGRLVLDPCDVAVRYVEEDPKATPQGMIGVAGARVSLPDQFPARVLYRPGVGGALRCELDLTNRRPDPALLLAKELSDRRGGGGGGGGGFSRSAGNSVGGGDEGTAPTWRVNDTDIGTRSRLNLKAGTGVTLAGTDDETDDEVEVLITASAGGTPKIPVLEEGVSVDANATHLDFGPGFDLAPGAAVALDLGEVVSGDVAFAGNAATVAAIQGKAVPAPGAPEDELFLQYDHGTGACAWAAPPGGPPQGTWSVANDSADRALDASSTTVNELA
ncbi:MAG TPA: hypothetical protein VFU47_17170, partial [Armatimonadota bacterium]|nr:hypothetical protein [Armatimonadota bacterium]